jgi:hypothetical protein
MFFRRKSPLTTDTTVRCRKKPFGSRNITEIDMLADEVNINWWNRNKHRFFKMKKVVSLRPILNSTYDEKKRRQFIFNAIF